MTTITVSFEMPDDRDDFDRQHNSWLAWSAIDDALLVIRNHRKHDAMTADQALKEIEVYLLEARSKLDD